MKWNIEGYCVWTNQVDYWETECDNAQIFTSGNIEDNEYKYCPYCGKQILDLANIPL